MSVVQGKHSTSENNNTLLDIESTLKLSLPKSGPRITEFVHANYLKVYENRLRWEKVLAAVLPRSY